MTTDASEQAGPDTQSQVSFENPDDRDDEMHSSIERWVHDLVEAVDEAAVSAAF